MATSNNDGRVLTDQEVAELRAYANAGIAAPDTYDGVVVDATDPRGVVYRFATAAERKAGEEAARASEQAAAEEARLTERVRAEAAKRGVVVAEAPPIPPKPGS